VNNSHCEDVVKAIKMFTWWVASKPFTQCWRLSCRIVMV